MWLGRNAGGYDVRPPRPREKGWQNQRRCRRHDRAGGEIERGADGANVKCAVVPMGRHVRIRRCGGAGCRGLGDREVAEMDMDERDDELQRQREQAKPCPDASITADPNHRPRPSPAEANTTGWREQASTPTNSN